MPEYKLIELNGKIPEIEAKINSLGDNWKVQQMILVWQRASNRRFAVLLSRAETE